MTDLLDPQPDDRVLEVGTGLGYQTAILAHLVAHVWTVDIVEEFVEFSAKPSEAHRRRKRQHPSWRWFARMG